MLYKKFLKFAMFALLALLALQLPLSRLIGSTARFTAFDFFAPTLGSAIGLWPGLAAVVISQFVNLLWHHNSTDIGTILRFIPALFACLYFSRQSRLNIILPLVAIVLFVAHPVGRQVWFYALYWLIPVLCARFHHRLLAKSLGATFTAHAVGGVLWLYVFNLPAQVWIGLIPTVAFERAIFALGIAGSYLAVKAIERLLAKSGQTVLVPLRSNKHEIS